MISLTAPHGFVIARVAAAVAARAEIAGRPRTACPTLPAGALSELVAILFEGSGDRAPLRALSLLGAAIGAPDGVIGVGAGCEILFADDAAEALLARGDALRRDRDGIAAASPRITETLRRAIADRRRHGMPGPGGSCLVDRAGGAPLSVLIVPPPFGRLDIVDDRPAALLFVADLARRQAEQLDRFRRRHALTPAEARFVAEIAKGDGLKAAGQRLGITLGTARTHLTHVFEKTGTRRQAELVGLLLQTEAAPASA